MKFKILWRPFQLNPEMPIEGMNRKNYLLSKYKNKDQIIKKLNQLKDAGKELGIFFQFDKISVTPNTLASHKLLALAHKYNKQNQVLETLFFQYFIEGKNIGNLDILSEVGMQYALFDSENENYLSNQIDNQNLLNEQLQAKFLGISGVPSFIFNKKYVIYGAQEKKYFDEIISSICNEH